MTFIIILIALGLEHFVSIFKPFRQYGWFNQYLNWWQGKLGDNAIITMVASLGVLLIAVYAVQAVLSHILFGLIGWLFQLAVLLYCLGDYELKEQFQRWLSLKEDDETAAADYYEANFAMAMPHGNALADFSGTLLCESTTRLFSVLFWFAILGPVGAVLYRMTRLSVGNNVVEEEGSVAQTAQALLHKLDWIPARLFGLSFCVVGNFTAVFPIWVRQLKNSLKDGLEMLKEVGVAALNISPDAEISGDKEQFDAVFGLIQRSMLVWLVVLALIFIF